MDVPKNPTDVTKPILNLPVESKDPGVLDILSEMFLKTDFKTAKNNVIKQQIVPGIQRILYQSAVAYIGQLFGMSAPPQNDNGSVFNNNISGVRYGAFYNQPTQPSQPQTYANPVPRPITGIDIYEQINYGSLDNAGIVINDMMDIASRFDGKVSVGHLCARTGNTNVSTDFTFGWTLDMLRMAKPYTDFNGCIRIVWPRPIALG